MKKLLIKKINKNNLLILKDLDTGKDEELFFEFFYKDNLGEKPKETDIIFLEDCLLDRKTEYFSQPFSYEFLSQQNDVIGKYIEKNPTEYLVLEHNDKKFIFKRIYG